MYKRIVAVVAFLIGTCLCLTSEAVSSVNMTPLSSTASSSVITVPAGICVHSVFISPVNSEVLEQGHIITKTRLAQSLN